MTRKFPIIPPVLVGGSSSQIFSEKANVFNNFLASNSSLYQPTVVSPQMSHTLQTIKLWHSRLHQRLMQTLDPNKATRLENIEIMPFIYS